MALQGDKVTDTQSPPLPSLEFIYFLKVQVISAKDLEASDLLGTSDPFCKVIANKQTWKTATIQKTLTPKWDEQTQFVFFDKPNDIKFEVFDADKRSKADSIGCATLDTSQFYAVDNAGYTGWLDLQDCDQGSIEVCVTGRLIKPLEMERKCEELEGQCKEQEKEIVDKKKQVSDLTTQNAQQQDKKKALETDLTGLTADKDALEEQIVAAQEENAKKKAQLDALNQKKQKYVEQKQQYQRDIATSEVQYGSIQSKYNEATDVNKDLQNQYETKRDSYNNEGAYTAEDSTYASNTSGGLTDPLLPSGP
eukprot:230704_1